MESTYKVTQDNTITTAGGYSTSVMVWRGINLIMSVFFLMATYVNLNDADWYLWVPIYLLASILSLAVVIKPDIADVGIWNSVTLLYLVFCVLYVIYQIVILAKVLSGKLQNPLQHEEGREMVGLFIVITWLGISRFTNIGRPNKVVSNKNLMTALFIMMVTLTFVPLGMWSLCYVGDLHKELGHCNNMFVHYKNMNEL